jgi:isoleucyl-tRNA synthetase
MKSENLNFNEQEVAEIRKKVFLIWWNMFAFYKMYAPNNHKINLDHTPKSADVMDQWILSKLYSLIKNTTQLMDNYDLVRASRGLMSFVDELSTWYLRRSRDRIRNTAESTDVFGFVLAKLAQLFAPFTPFFSELMWHNLISDTTSVHHADWPTFNEELIQTELEEQMESIKKVVEKTHALRSEAGIKVRQPLAKVTCFVTTSAPAQNILEVLSDEVNVKEIEWKQSTESLRVILDTNLTDELIQEGEARELIRNIQKLRKKAGLQVGDTATVQAPAWPENWQAEIEKKTGTKLKSGNELKLIEPL